MSPANDLMIANLVRSRVQTMPDLDVLTFECDGQTEVRTYEQLWQNGQRLAGALQSRGMQKGDRFGLLLRNHPEFVEAMVASAILGTVFVPVDPRTKGEKLAFMLEHSGCRGVICGDYALADAVDSAATTPGLAWFLVVGSEWAPSEGPGAGTVHAFRDALAGPVPDVPVAVGSETEPMAIMYTSGTSGDPKGMVVRHARFAAVAGHGEAVFGYRPGDRPYTGLSLTHGNAQFVTLAPSLNMGLRAVFSRRFTKSRLWDIVREHGCTSFSLLGGMATAIYSEPRRPDDADNPVRHVISAGMPAPIWQDFAERFGVAILEFYAAVEGGMTINPVGEGPIGSCGRVAPGLVARVVDADGDDVPPGTPGELWFRPADGSAPVVEYFDDVEASRRKVEGGWLHSGDVVRMDAGGWVFFEHRVGGEIRRNGEFVYPEFVAKALSEHDSVDDVFVFGVPAASGAVGEKDVVAAIVPVDATTFDAPAVFEWCRQKLEPNMVPSYLQVVDEVPKTASEKPQTRFLLKRFEEEPESVFRP
jgi:crotonobetaine/carnitine-CoA ligase